MRDEAEMANIGLIAGEGQQTTYLVIVECDGGSNHKLYHLSNHISLFVLLLVVNMDKLVSTRSFPGLYYLNTSEQAMAILNVGLSGLLL